MNHALVNPDERREGLPIAASAPGNQDPFVFGDHSVAHIRVRGGHDPLIEDGLFRETPGTGRLAPAGYLATGPSILSQKPIAKSLSFPYIWCQKYRALILSYRGWKREFMSTLSLGIQMM